MPSFIRVDVCSLIPGLCIHDSSFVIFFFFFPLSLLIFSFLNPSLRFIAFGQIFRVRTILHLLWWQIRDLHPSFWIV